MRYTIGLKKASPFAILLLLPLSQALALDPVVSSVASFNVSNGANPFATLTLGNGSTLYGTTEYGGALGNEQGTLFQYNVTTHQLDTLFRFGGTNGTNPIGRLLFDGNDTLYGTARSGGASGAGTIFQYSIASQTLTTLFSFDGSLAASPYAGLTLDPQGNLCGTSYTGGANDLGTVFKFDVATHTLTTLAEFDGQHGANPFGGVVSDSQGNLYGTTRGGGTDGKGTVFKITADTHSLTTLGTFTGTNGDSPVAGLKLGADGNLYGTTSFGGLNDGGVIFRISSDGNTFATLASFDDDSGQNPFGELMSDADGNLYGTTQSGGPQGGGTVFKLSSSGNVLTTLAAFDFGGGWGPDGGVIADADGNFYGSTYYGGSNHNSSLFPTSGDGTLFEISDTGFVTAVPEPASLTLFAAGMILLAVAAPRHRASVGAKKFPPTVRSPADPRS